MAVKITTQRNLPRQERSLERVRQIIDSAAALFDEIGIANATPSDIAKASGLTRTSLYRYFPNKASIIRALAERHLDALQLRFSEIPTDLPIEGRIELLVETYAEFYRLEPGYMAVWSGVDSLPELKSIDQSASDFHSALIQKQAATIVDNTIQQQSLRMISIILPRTVGAILRLAVQDPERDELYVKEAKTLAKIYLTHYANPA
jgi:AcrR family transcriptional regulator